MDIVYYSNYCAHSKKILQYLAKENLTNQFNCICIDKRSRDPQTGQIKVHLENGQTIMMPPNVHSVPALLLVKQNFRVVLGDDILPILHPLIKKQRDAATRHQGEPTGFSIGSYSGGSTNIMSEKFTSYDLTPEELSAKGRGVKRSLYNYVSADSESLLIQTPPDNYRPDKVSGDVSLDTLEQRRNEDVTKFFPTNSPYVPQSSNM
jgi:hypothetical protein